MSPAKNRPGAMLLVTVMLIGATALTITLGTALRGIGELEIGVGDNRGAEALAIADGCAEEGLLRVNRSDSYTGATLNVGDGSCNITVTNLGGTQKAIVIEATLDSWVRRVQVEVDRSSMEILKWVQE